MATKNPIENSNVSHKQDLAILRDHYLSLPSHSLLLRKKVNASLKYLLLFTALFASILIFLITAYIFFESVPIITSFSSIIELVFSTEWYPKIEKFGSLNLFIGSFIVAFYATIIAIPIGIGVGIFLSEVASPKTKKIIKPIIEVITAIPSVIIGLVASRFLSIAVMNTFFALDMQNEYSSGRIAITASIALGFMVIPVIASLTDDALSSVPNELKKASLALGSSKWETIPKISVPYAKSGIISSCILAFGRVIGETMVVLMVTGSNPGLNKGWFNPLQSVYPVPAVIALETGDVVIGDPQWHALFFVGLQLLLVSFVITGFGRLVVKKQLSFGGIKKILNIVVKKKHSKQNKQNTTPVLTPPDTNFVGKSIIREEVDNRNHFHPKTTVCDCPLDEIYESTPLNIRKKFMTQYIVYTLFGFLTVSMLLGLTSIVVIVVYFGVQDVWLIDFFQSPTYTYKMQGHYGYLQATLGSILVVTTAAVLGLPLSTLAGIYLQFYVKENNRFGEFVKNSIQNIASVPSIIVGLFGWGLFVLIFGWGKSVLAGGATLTIMMIPIATSTTIEALKQVPSDYRLNALALGSTKWESINKQNIRYAMPSIITGYLFSISRVIGETAPIILTVAASIYSTKLLPTSLVNMGVAMLPFEIYTLALFGTSPYSLSWAMTCAMVLLLMALVLYTLGQILRVKLQVKYE